MPGENTGGGDGGTGGGKGGSERQGERRGPRVIRGARRRPRYERPSDLVESLITRFGNRDSAIEGLAKENYELREERREFEEENEELKKSVVPKDAVVLTGDDKKKWDAVKAIELPGEKIVERVNKAKELETEKQKTELAAKCKAVAQAAGMNGDVLHPLLDQFGLEVETREVELQDASGKSLGKKPVAHVRKAGDANAAWEKLSDFVARDGSPLKPFSAALATKGTTSGTGNQGSGGAAILFPDQQGGGNSGGGNPIVDQFIKQDAERAASKQNPLRPPPAAKTA